MLIDLDSLYDEFQEVCATYLPQEARERLHKAFLFACQAHANDRRDNGDLYITHPLTVALYMARLYMDEMLLVGALLHDVAEDTEFTLANIEREFGPQARHLVEGVTHLSGVSQLEDVANLFLMASRDVRVVLIKLFDRLHNMQTLGHQDPERRRRKAQETLDIYVPLAAKLGIWQLKSQFETLILAQLDPAGYAQITAELNHRRKALPQLEQIAGDIQHLLRGKGLPCSVAVRQRGPYQIYRNLLTYRLESRAFSKAFQIAVLVDGLPQCYLALAHIHEKYPHIAGSLVDTIGNPRDTFYRSLHSSIMSPAYMMPLPIRIRTYEFDRLAELGILAELQFATPGEEQQPQKAPWLPQLPKLYRESENATKFMESVFKDILQKQMTCFTPKGDKIHLPRGATILDFAYQVHSKIGHECRGGMVNGQAADLNHPLMDGDQVDVIRSGRPEPCHEWLDDTLGYATTSRTTRKIREWFRKQPYETQIIQGREILQAELRRFNVGGMLLQRLREEFGADNDEQFFLSIGSGMISNSDLARAILKHSPTLLRKVERNLIQVEDAEGNLGYITRLDSERGIRFAYCCEPKVDDEIVAHIGRGKILLHRASCRHILRTRHQDNIVHLLWQPSNQPTYMAYLRLEGYDRPGLIRDIAATMSSAGANIIRLDCQTDHQSYRINNRLKFEVTSETDLIRILHRLAQVPNISLARCMTSLEVEKWEFGFLPLLPVAAAD